MKKILILLLVMLCLLPVAQAEEECPLEFRMGLAQIQFAEPGEVTVTISVTNVSGKDMPGPLALYWPNGMMVTEFGTPTLLAGETRTWQGTWNVTAEQLNAGKVVFAVQYIRTAADGSLERKVQPFYMAVEWEQKPAQTAEIVLKGNPSTGYSWGWQIFYGSGHVDIADETNASDEESALLGAPEKFTYVVKGVKPGDVEICFTYAQPWEQDPAMGLYNLYYYLNIDDDLNVTILGSRFDW